MIDRYYRFADIVIQIRQDQEEILPLIEKFEVEAVGEPQIVFELYQGNRNYRQCYGVEYYSVQYAKTPILSPAWDTASDTAALKPL